VVRISDDPHRFDEGSTLQRADGTILTVESSRSHGERLLVKFLGIDGRDNAEILRGPLFVSPSALRSLEEGEFWHHELIGMTAVASDGSALGTVTEVVPGAAQDLLALDTPAGPRLVPLVSEIVGDVDRDERTVTLHPPDGLLD
jgi:16S rRNA processing protein RimM